MTLLESLKASTPYPTPKNVLLSTAILRGLDVDAETTLEGLNSNGFRLSKADLFKWLYLVPDVTQEGISYSFSDEDKKAFKSEANAIYEDLGEPIIEESKTVFGYKGNRL